jgi:hypothetical protein
MVECGFGEAVVKRSQTRDEGPQMLDARRVAMYNRAHMNGRLVRKLFFAAGIVVFLTGVLIAILMPNDFACGPEQAGSCDATLPVRIGFAGAGVAGGIVLAAVGIWLERYRR